MRYRNINKAGASLPESVAEPAIAVAIATPLYWLSSRFDFLPGYDFIWWLDPRLSFVAKEVSGHVLSMVGTSLLVYAVLRLTGACAMFRVGRGVLALTASALFLPTALLAILYVAYPDGSRLSFAQALFYERNLLTALSAVIAGAAVLLALLGNRFEFHWHIQRRRS